jgi:ATP-dependent DNA ligase
VEETIPTGRRELEEIDARLKTILYSRNGKNFNKRYPCIAEALSGLPPDTVVDGEVVALDDSGRPDFHRLQHFGAEAPRIHYFVFDLLSRVSRIGQNPGLH